METLATRRIKAGISRLIMQPKFAYFGVLALNLAVVERPDIETMATNGAELFHNPTFTLEQTEAHLEGILAHEAYHCALLHMCRMAGRDLGEWNIATDLAINWDLRQAGFSLPDWVWYDAQYAGMSAEQIYDMRAQARRKAGGQASKPAQWGNGAGKPGADSQGQGQPSNSAGAPSQGQGQGTPGAGTPWGCGGIMPAGDGGSADAATQETRWQVIARQASAVASKGIGAMPGVAERLLGHINAPDASDILDRLTDFIDSRVAVDYSFSRPNRRFVHAGFYLPGTTVDGLEHLVFAVDTSGSIDAHMLRKCGEKLAGALDSGKVQRITVLFADTHVRHVQVFERGDDIAAELRPRGGGGTGFSDTFRWIAANAPDATAAIYLTDMLCNDWGSEPDCPMLWAVHGTRAKAERLMKAAPFGEAVYIGLLE